MNFLIKGSDLLARYPGFELVGRDVYLQRLLSILLRRSASSVVLAGPRGVGCTALILGIQLAKQQDGAPYDVTGRRLFWLDVNGLFASGDSEEVNHAFHRILDRLKSVDGSVLVVEDARDLLEACRNSGTLHFINALLAAVREGRTQVILEAADDDLETVLRCGSDVREMFTILAVDEPAGPDLAAIVTSSAAALSKHHGIRIEPDAATAAIELTTRYQSQDGWAQPARTLTLLDRALASYRLAAHKNGNPEHGADIRRLIEERRRTQNLIAELEDRADEYRLLASAPDNARSTIFSGIDAPEVSQLRSQARELHAVATHLNEQLAERTKAVDGNLALTRPLVLSEFAEISGISVAKLGQNEREKLRGIEAILLRRIFGQTEVVSRVAGGVRVARAGRRDRARPLAYLFLGPSGVGKTELSKALAAALLDDEAALTRFDMSEYMEKHGVAKLIGAPPGYEGFEAGGILTNLMRRNAYRILLFDEIEKAHPDVFNIFLQVLDDGRLTDNVGRTVSFADATIVMTTNIGQAHFLDASLTTSEAEAAAMDELNSTYRSEFLNRFAGRQNILCFKSLDLDSIERIVRRELAVLDRVYGERGLRVEMSDEQLKIFCQDQYDPRIGARGLPGFISATLEPALADRVLAEDQPNGTAQVSYEPSAHKFHVEVR